MSQCLYINLYYMFIEKQERRWLRFYHHIRNLIKSTDRTHLLVIYWPLLCGGGSGWAMFDRFPCVGGRGSSCFLEIAHVYLYREIRNEFVAMIDKWYSFFFSESVNHHLWKEFKRLRKFFNWRCQLFWMLFFWSGWKSPLIYQSACFKIFISIHEIKTWCILYLAR